MPSNMKDVFIIFSAQDCSIDNHQGLWSALADGINGDVVVINTPADQIATRLLHKSYKIREAKQPCRKLKDNLFIVRPLYFIRPELLPVWALSSLRKSFWASVKKAIPDIFSRHVDLLAYGGTWVKALDGSHPDMNIGYFIIDEVRLDADTDRINKRKYKLDEFACTHAKVVFTMTPNLAESRKCLNNNIHVLGNGANVPPPSITPIKRIDKSVAFIGNFRDWIDEELLEGLIKKETDVTFVFAGRVDANMRSFFDHILNSYLNTVFIGYMSKNDVHAIYEMVDGVIVPYKQNKFMLNTRPIKIVESVLAGTPVITIPMGGFSNSEFVRYATNIESFSKEIRYVIDHHIDKSSPQFLTFVLENSWAAKSNEVIREFNNIR